MFADYRGQDLKARSDWPTKLTGSSRGGPGPPFNQEVEMEQRPKANQPESSPMFAARIWHWRAKKYIYASDYGIKAFPYEP